jgi:hypothetical protein
MRALAARGFPAGEELGLPPLVDRLSLFDQQVMAPWENLLAPAELGDSSLESVLLLQKVTKMRSPPGWVTRPWMDSPVEPLEHLQAVLPQFLLQVSN